LGDSPTVELEQFSSGFALLGVCGVLFNNVLFTRGRFGVISLGESGRDKTSTGVCFGVFVVVVVEGRLSEGNCWTSSKIMKNKEKNFQS